MTFAEPPRFRVLVQMSRLKVTALVKKWGQFRAPKSKPLPCSYTPEQLERARAAMQEIYGDASTLGRWHG